MEAIYKTDHWLSHRIKRVASHGGYRRGGWILGWDAEPRKTDHPFYPNLKKFNNPLDEPMPKIQLDIDPTRLKYLITEMKKYQEV